MRSLYFFLLLLSTGSFAQTANDLTPVGSWREHLPYIQTTNLSATGSKIICSTPYSFFTYDIDDNSIERFSRMNGLAETGVSMMLYDDVSEKLLVVYTNSNIDVVTENKIVNIPDIKISTVSGDKTVYNIFFSNDKAYLSSGIGVILLDLLRNEVKDTYFIGNGGGQVKVNGFTSDNNFFYAATNEGLKRAPVNSPNLADHTQWSNISGNNGLATGAVQNVFFTQNKLFAVKSDSVFSWNGTAWSLFYTETPLTINRVHAANNRIAICLVNKVVFLNVDGSIDKVLPNSASVVFPQDAVFHNNSYYVADLYVGLSKFTGTSSEKIIPNSPYSTASGDVISDGKNIWAAAGEVNEAWNYTFNRQGIFHLDEDNKWTTFSQFNGYPQWDTLMDFIALAIDKRNQNLYAGSYGGGLLELRPDNSFHIYKQGTGLQPALGDPNNYRVSGLAFDINNNLWISNYLAPNALVVKKEDSTWRSFNIPFLITDNAVAQIIIDDYDQKWIVCPKGNGLVCFNHGSTIDDINDDKWKWYRAGSSNGNLPDNNVFCIAKDKDGFIWVGTAKGVAIIACVDNVFTSSCNAIQPIVQEGAFAGYLFANEEVRTIAVDGANRKWIGTKNGVWLISPDGEKVIERFTEDNSFLLSNDVKKITVDPVTGEVFILTFKGICSYRGTATEGTTVNENVLVFPNPVPPTYKGMIAIRGVASNAIVKITELDGRLVYQTKAFGGQAVWNGKNYKGQDVSSGVYLVLIADETNQEKAAAKIVIIR